MFDFFISKSTEENQRGVYVQHLYGNISVLYLRSLFMMYSAEPRLKFRYDWLVWKISGYLLFFYLN